MPAHGSAHGSDPRGRALQYVAKNFFRPKGIEGEAAKAGKQLWPKPATAGEVCHYLKSNPGFSNYVESNLYLEPRIARKTDIQVRGAKLSKTAASPFSAPFCGTVASSFFSAFRPPIRRSAGLAGPT